MKRSRTSRLRKRSSSSRRWVLRPSVGTDSRTSRGCRRRWPPSRRCWNGSAHRLLTAVIGKRGCGPAAAFLLAHDVPLAIDHTAYNVLHEAAWAAAADTLRAVFESGAADATGVSARPHTGWPDNLPLMYWAAWGGYPEVARLLAPSTEPACITSCRSGATASAAPPRCRRRSRPATGTGRRTRAKAPWASCAATPGRESWPWRRSSSTTAPATTCTPRAPATTPPDCVN